MIKIIKTILLEKSISKLMLEWHKNNKTALVTAVILAEITFYLMTFSLIGFNDQYFTHLINMQAVGTAWLVSAQALLFYVWIFLYAVLNQIKVADNHLIKVAIVCSYFCYITYIFYIVGIVSIFTGIALISTALATASLLKNKIVWRLFILQSFVLLFLSFIPFYSFSIPIQSLHDVNQKAIGFSWSDYSFFWTVFYLLLSLPKAILGALASLYLYTSINTKLEKAQYSATYDELTRVKNRRFIMNYLFDIAYDKEGIHYETKPTTAQDVSVIIVDLDYFKAINDTHGHLSGDMVLIEVAKRLTDGMLMPSWQASRYGGEEFLIVLPEVPHNAAMKAAKHIHELIRTDPITIVDGLSINVTSSMGVATLSDDEITGMREYYRVNFEKNANNKSNTAHNKQDNENGNSTKKKLSNYEELIIERMINMADEALYEAKRNGRNQIKSAHHYIDEASAKIDREKNMQLADEILDALDIEVGY